MFFHKKGWGKYNNPAHIEPLPIPLIKETYTGKSDGDDVKLKLRRDPTSIMSDLNEFRMSLFGHGEPEESLLFVSEPSNDSCGHKNSGHRRKGLLSL